MKLHLEVHHCEQFKEFEQNDNEKKTSLKRNKIKLVTIPL